MDDPVKASKYIKGKTRVTILFALIRLDKFSAVKKPWNCAYNYELSGNDRCILPNIDLTYGR